MVESGEGARIQKHTEERDRIYRIMSQDRRATERTRGSTRSQPYALVRHEGIRCSLGDI